ncbi:MAG TPA: hypothetical protein VFO40_25855, partial [Chthoniobacterales bacterium]|nr:hypothetical protein [Chthoniobacterales bacterium]
NILICEFTNPVHSSVTPKLSEFLAKQGVHWNVFKSAHRPISEPHNRQGTPLLAERNERQA